jgi:hypothetical protein
MDHIGDGVSGSLDATWRVREGGGGAMSTPPNEPKIYHITHVDNLAAMAAEGWLLSDARMIERGGPRAPIGMSRIKQRRLALPVACHPGTCVGDYVPFYFCPRSVMLYVLHRSNAPDLAYQGGEWPIVHLEADLHAVVDWAKGQGFRWAFSLSNAGAFYAGFRASLDQLSDLNWEAIREMDFRDPDVKEGKQAEFLLHGAFPWHLVSRIGVISPIIQATVRETLGLAPQIPPVVVLPGWYF